MIPGRFECPFCEEEIRIVDLLTMNENNLMCHKCELAIKEYELKERVLRYREILRKIGRYKEKKVKGGRR